MTGRQAKGLWKEGSRMGGYSLGDTLIGMVIFIFGIIPRQFLSLAQQTSHPHSPWDSTRQGLLLPPPGPLSHFPLIINHTPWLPHHRLLHPQPTTQHFYFCFCTPPPSVAKTTQRPGDRVRIGGKH